MKLIDLQDDSIVGCELCQGEHPKNTLFLFGSVFYNADGEQFNIGTYKMICVSCLQIKEKR